MATVRRLLTVAAILAAAVPDARAQYYCLDLWPNPPAELPAAWVGEPYDEYIVVRHMVPDCSGWWTISGSVPPGLVVERSEWYLNIVGQATTPGSYAFFVQFTCWCGDVLTGWYEIEVLHCDPIDIAPAQLPGGMLGVPYYQRLQASGGTPPYLFSSQGGLPPGISLSEDTLAGTPSRGGTFPFEVAATDGSGCVGRRSYELAIGCSAVISVGPADPPRAAWGVPYATSLTATGGQPPHAFRVVAGALPEGLALDPSGSLHGAPRVVTTADLVVRAVDALGCEGRGAVRLTVTAAERVAAGLGHGPSSEPRVFLINKVSMVSFLAYGVPGFGVSVGAADLDGDLYDEALTGPGPGPSLGPHVRGFQHTGSPMPRLSFFAYGTLRYGAIPAGASLDADGSDEILTGPGMGSSFGPHVRGWDLLGGSPRPLPGLSFYAYGTLQHGARCASGALDGDAEDELVTVPGGGPSLAPHVRGFDFAGSRVAPIPGLGFLAFPSAGFGAIASVGDADGDSRDDLAVAPGPGPALAAQVRGFAWTSPFVESLPGFDEVVLATLHGARLALSDHDGDLRANLLVAPGPDPAARPSIVSVTYSGTELERDGWSIVVWPDAAYGAEVAEARLSP